MIWRISSRSFESSFMRSTSASVVICPDVNVTLLDSVLLNVPNPKAAFAEASLGRIALRMVILAGELIIRPTWSRQRNQGNQEQRNEDKGNCVQELDKNVKAGPRGIFPWIANRVTDDSCRMGFGVFSSEVSCFNILFRIIHGSSSPHHHYGQRYCRECCANHECSDCSPAEEYAHNNRRHNWDCTGYYHQAQSRPGGNIHRGCIVRLGGPFSKPRDFPELSSDLLDHAVGANAYCIDCSPREDEGEHAPNQGPYDYIWMVEC